MRHCVWIIVHECLINLIFSEIEFSDDSTFLGAKNINHSLLLSDMSNNYLVICLAIEYTPLKNAHNNWMHTKHTDQVNFVEKDYTFEHGIENLATSNRVASMDVNLSRQ